MEIKNILMRRDGCTEQEAEDRIAECRLLCEERLASGDYDEVEEILASELGLEPDDAEELLGPV